MLAAIVVIQVLLPSSVDFVPVMVSSSFHHPAMRHSSLSPRQHLFFLVATYLLHTNLSTVILTYILTKLNFLLCHSGYLINFFLQSQELIKSRVSELPPTYTTETQRWNQFIWEAQTLDCISAGVKEK